MELLDAGRQMDRTNLVGAFSGSGGYGHESCPAGVPVELALLSILAAFGVAFGVLFTALTQITGRRRKRSLDSSGENINPAVKTESEVDPFFKFADILLFGEFFMMRYHCELHQRKYHNITQGGTKGWQC